MHHSIHTREVKRNDDYDREPEQKEVASLPCLGHMGIGRGGDEGTCGKRNVAQDILEF